MKRISGAFSLIEMVVTAGLLTVVGLVMTTYLSNSFQIYRRGQVSSAVHGESSSLTSRISNALRGTFKVEATLGAAATVLTYLAPTDTVPTKLTIQHSGTSIQYITIVGVLSGDSYIYDPASATTRTITTHQSSSSSTPLFRYYNESNTLLTDPVSVTAVHLIEVTTTIISPEDANQSATASTKVELRNLKTNL